MPAVTNTTGRERFNNLDIRHVANNLLHDSDAFPDTDNCVIDTGKILDHLGYSYYEFDPVETDSLSNIKGAVMHESKKVYLNSRLSLQERNFALAHEIGHIMLHGKLDKIDFLQHEVETVEVEEIEANVFAYELLMPLNVFRKKYGKITDTCELAKFYCLTEKRIKKRIDFDLRTSSRVEKKLSVV